MDYANGKIYKLVSNVIPDIYIGSTCTELKKRKYRHKSHYESWKKGLFAYVSSFKLFEAGKVEIVLIESFPCTSKDELFARERFWIENTVCVNKCIPGRTDAEYYEQNKDKILEYQKEYRLQNKDKISEYQKEYHEQNKEKISERTKEYYEQNKEKISEQQKEYYEQNKDKISERQKEYYEQNKDKILERRKEYQKEYRLQNKDKLLERRHKKVACESCGKEVSKTNLSRHQKTKECLSSN